MQLGIIGLGRMGANLVRRLMRDGHECVVYDPNPQSVTAVATDGATGVGSVQELASQLTAPRPVWVMVPAGQITQSVIEELAEELEAGDTVMAYSGCVRESQRLPGVAAMSPAVLYNLVLCAHLFGAFTLVSGMAIAIVGLETASRRENCTEIAVLLGIARVGAMLLIAGTILVASFGLWLVHLGKWGYGTPWVVAAISLLSVVVILGAIGGQRPKKARRLATRLAEAGCAPNDELRAMLNDRVTIVLNYLSGAALLGIIVIMVVKPG
jgi:uncharacterized membrane protein